MTFARCVLALAACIAACCAAAQAGADEQLLAALVRLREQGCRGHAGTGAPLHLSASLSRAAARMAAGEGALSAVEHEGFRATRVFHSNFVGYRTVPDVANALAAHYCGDLVEARFTDFGMHRDGAQWTLVLAARFQLPKLTDARAAGERVLTLVNDARSHARRCGDRQFGPAPALRWNGLLEEAAGEHARDMAVHAVLDHKGHDGSTPAQRVSRTGYRWRSVGENVAAGQASADDVVEDWLSSPGHCANIMEPSFTDMAVAFAVNMKANAAVYWAQEFGRPR